MTSLVLGILLSVLGGVAMNLALTDTEMAYHQRRETSARILAEGGVEQVIAWLNHGELPARGLPEYPPGCRGTENTADVTYDAGRPDDDRLLNDRVAGVFRMLSDLGRMNNIQLYRSTRPEGFCTIVVTAETKDRVRRSVSLELGATWIPPVQAAVQAGARRRSDVPPLTRIWAHWGNARIAGDVHLGRDDRFPRKWAAAAVTGVGYGDAGGLFEDRWTEVWVGGQVESDDADYQLPANVHANQDPVPGIPADPWQYQKFKELAIKFGRYYVPDRAGWLYRDGLDVARGQTFAEVIAENSETKGLVFIDTVDQALPSSDNMPTLAMNSSSIEGLFFINAHVVFNPDGEGRTVTAWSPPTESQILVSRVATRLSDINLQGVFHTTGRIQIDRRVRVFGSVVAEQGLVGTGTLEVWYDHDAARGLFRGLPVVFPLPGTWREWGS